MDYFLRYLCLKFGIQYCMLVNVKGLWLEIWGLVLLHWRPTLMGLCSATTSCWNWKPLVIILFFWINSGLHKKWKFFSSQEQPCRWLIFLFPHSFACFTAYCLSSWVSRRLDRWLQCRLRGKTSYTACLNSYAEVSLSYSQGKDKLGDVCLQVSQIQKH